MTKSKSAKRITNRQIEYLNALGVSERMLAKQRIFTRDEAGALIVRLIPLHEAFKTANGSTWATGEQRDLIRRHDPDFDGNQITKKAASKLCPATAKQIKSLESREIPVEPGLTVAQASKLIGDHKRMKMTARATSAQLVLLAQLSALPKNYNDLTIPEASKRIDRFLAKRRWKEHAEAHPVGQGADVSQRVPAPETPPQRGDGFQQEAAISEIPENSLAAHDAA